MCVLEKFLFRMNFFALLLKLLWISDKFGIVWLGKFYEGFGGFIELIMEEQKETMYGPSRENIDEYQGVQCKYKGM